MIKAIISKINLSLGYGFAKTHTYSPIFFTKDSLQDPNIFDKISIGDRVEIEPMDTERGTTAAKMIILRTEIGDIKENLK